MEQIWKPKPAKASPVTEVGLWGWMYKNLFSTPLNTLLTLIGVAFLLWVIPPMIRWAIIDANWTGDSRDACNILSSDCSPGACWVFIKVRFELFMYGFYPEIERWRINLAFVFITFASLPHLAPDFFATRMRQLVLAAVATISIGTFYGAGWALAAVTYFLAPFVLAQVSLREVVFARTEHTELLAFGASCCVAILAYFALGSLGQENAALAVAGSFFILVFPIFYCKKLETVVWRWVLLIAVYPVMAFYLFVGNAFGLAHVETHFWGGLFLTLVVAGTGMATAMPIGILLALGRTSELPVIRGICVSFIEFVRGVPLVSVLFMASVMFPLFLPENVNFDKLLRALVGVAFFYAAYIAEVIRGGLQAIPKGQFEAAEALGWTYWKKMSVIILPQTLRLVIPGLANNFLSLLKDTTLVAVIGLLDLLGVAKAALADAEWLGFTKEAYVFAGLVFWVFCFAISRYSNYLEKKYHTNYQS